MTLSSLIRNSLLTGVCIGMLSGCSWLEDWDWPPKDSKNNQTAQVSAPPPPNAQIKQTAGGSWLQDGATQTVNANIPSHQSPKGLNIDEAAAQRIAALEAEVANLRNELRTMMPAVAKLAAAQGDLQSAMNNIQPAAGSTAAPTDLMQQNAVNNTGKSGIQQDTAQAATGIRGNVRANGRDISNNVAVSDGNQVQAPAAQKKSGQANDIGWYEAQEAKRRDAKAAASVEPAAAPASSEAALPQANVQNNGSDVFVRNIRFGEHADKTRLVLDTSDQVAFRYDIDNKEQLLVIEMPETGWRGSDAMEIANSPLVSSYSVIADGKGGHQLIMQLKKPAEVLWAQALLPGGPQGHRIVVDLAPI